MGRIPLLDLGNVIVKVEFAPFLDWLAQKAGHCDTGRVAPLLGSSLFYDFESGQIRPEEFRRRLERLYGVCIGADELEERFCSIFPGLVEGMESALEELAGQGPVYCLSNTNEIHLEFCRRRFPVISRFRTIFASHLMGKRKPYPGIYRDVAARIGAEPARIVFFDDAPANVEGALRAGLDAHIFQGVREFVSVLKDS